MSDLRRFALLMAFAVVGGLGLTYLVATAHARSSTLAIEQSKVKGDADWIARQQARIATLTATVAQLESDLQAARKALAERPGTEVRCRVPVEGGPLECAVEMVPR